jgi:PAS domain S-box-containing protein
VPPPPPHAASAATASKKPRCGKTRIGATPLLEIGTAKFARAEPPPSRRRPIVRLRHPRSGGERSTNRMTPETPDDFRRLADEVPLFVWTQAPDGTVDWANRAWYDYVRLPRELATTAEGWARVVHPDDVGEVVAAFERAARSRTTYETEHRLKPADADDSAYRWFLVRSVPRFDAAGEIVSWVGTGVDIHDSKVLAAKDTASFRVIADAVPQMMWSALPDGWIDWYNARWFEYTGQTRDEAAGWGWQAVHHPDDLPAVMRAWPESIATGEPFEMEFRLRRADGAFRWFLTRAIPMHGANGAIVRWYGTNTDIDAEHGARARERFFSQLGAELSGALSLEQTLRVVTRSIVPQFADWAVVNLIDERNDVRLAAAYHSDPEKRELLEAARGESYATPSGLSGVARVVRTGKPVVYEAYTEDVLRESIEAEFRARLERIGIESALIVPLFSGGKVVGTLNAVMGGSGRAFTAADVPFLEELGRRIAPAIGNATAYERERRVATTFQRAALVPALPEIPGLTFEAMYQAAMLEATVGGDWYDVFRLPDGRVVLSIGDVAGKGLQAAVAMASVRQSIRTAALINPDPVAVLNAVDRIVRAMGDAPFVTAFVGVLEPVSFELTFASAGHPPALLRDANGTVTSLAEGDLPLGLRERSDDGARTVAIAPGSVLLCYTDGLTEFDRDPVAGERRVREELARAGGDIANGIYARIAQDRPANDDVAILAVTFRAPLVALDDPRRASVWRFGSSDAERAGIARHECVERLHAAGLSDDETSSAELVFGELVGNVVRYAPGDIAVMLDVSGPAAVLHVLDDGRGFEFRPRLPVDLLSERGRGLFLVTAFAEELSVERRRGGGGSHARAVLAGRTRYGTAAGSKRDAVI